MLAIPGSIQSVGARGCNGLIRDGAMLVESPADVFAALGLCDPPCDPGPGRKTRRASAKRAMGDAQDEGGSAGDGSRGKDAQWQACALPPEPGTPESRVLAELGHDPAPIDVLAARTGLSGAVVQAAVLALELDGRIEWLPDARGAPR